MRSTPRAKLHHEHGRDDRTPVILMTGYAEELGAAASLDVEVLPKPCSAEAIIAAVQRARAKPQHPRRTAAI